MSTNAPATAKLDAYLQKALAEQRPGLLRVMIRIAARDGADPRVRALLTDRGRSVASVLSGGRLLVTVVEVSDLVPLAASDDVERISFDAIVKV